VWYDFWTQERVEGGREVSRKVALETIPVYVRAGAVIPMGPVRQYTGEAVENPVTLWVHGGSDGGCVWYEDDGTTFDFRKGESGKVRIGWNDRQRRLSLRLAEGAKMFGAGKRKIAVRVAGKRVPLEGCHKPT
jgi:alpha-glucosidase (family GH31 glycosyl hydrolase)